METHPNFSVVSEGCLPVESDNIEKLFSLEIESWCHGLAQFQEPVSPKLMYALVQEMSGTFLAAVSAHYAFDLVGVAKRLHTVSDGIVNEKELTFYILAHLPNPSILNSECLAVFKSIVARAQNIYPDVVKKFESRLKGQSAKS